MRIRVHRLSNCDVKRDINRDYFQKYIQRKMGWVYGTNLYCYIDTQSVGTGEHIIEFACRKKIGVAVSTKYILFSLERRNIQKVN